MQKLLVSFGVILFSFGAVCSQAATPKPEKAPTSNATQTKPSGADALRGTGTRALPKPPGAGALTEKWQTFKAPGIELSLPDTYRGGSPNTTGLQTLIKGIRSLGQDYEQIASLVEQNPTTFLLIAVDPKPDRTGGITNVVISSVKVPETVTVDAYIDAAVQSLPDPIRTIERKTVQVGPYPAGRLVTEASMPSTAKPDALRQLIYVIKQGQTLWTVAYSTRAGDYPQRLAMFEQSIQSFKVQSDQKPSRRPTIEKTPPKKPAKPPLGTSKPPAASPAIDGKKPTPNP